MKKLKFITYNIKQKSANKLHLFITSLFLYLIHLINHCNSYSIIHFITALSNQSHYQSISLY